MTPAALNRLTGRAAPLPAFGVAGLWTTPRAGLLNGLPVPAGVHLLPDMRGLLTWSAPPEMPVTVGFPGPGEDRLALGSLDAALTGLALEESGWDAWVRTSPMDRDLADDLQRFPLEEAMEQDLLHLEAVCRQPRTHLEIFEERQLVSRARQIPVRAVNYLASHTEDWEGRTLRGVRPRRVITNVRDDLYDIYENRVAVRLVDHLTRYVRRRLARIKELLQGLQTIDLNAQEPPSGMHWRQQRIYRLWGEALDLLEAQLLASERLEELNRFLYRLERLRASLLYTSVPAKSQVAPQLRITNILGNDPHYRRVARLWMAWYRHAHTGHPSLQEQQATAQQEATQFDRYAFLLLVHALEQFEFTPLVQRECRPGTSLPLRGPEGEVELSWNGDGAASLRRGEEEILRLVASPTPLADLRTDEMIRVLDALRSDADGAPCQTILVYPGNAGRITTPELHAASGDPHSLHARLSCVPVSPVDLESVERLSRVLRWVLTGSRLAAYPPSFTADVPVPQVDFPTDLLRQDRSGAWELLGPLPGRPVSWVQERQRRQAALDSARAQVDSLTGERLRLRQAQRDVERREAELDVWETFLNGIDSSESQLTALRRCPVCGTAHASFTPWPDGQFACVCDDCGAHWSLRRCQTCGRHHPWLLPHLREVPVIKPVVGWADQLYGRDVLTLPDPLDLGGFTCPAS